MNNEYLTEVHIAKRAFEGIKYAVSGERNLTCSSSARYCLRSINITKEYFLLMSLSALIFSGATCAQTAPPILPTFNVQGEEFSSACTPQNKATLSAQLPAEARGLIETLLCANKSAAVHAYIADHISKTLKYIISSTGSKDEIKRILVNAELIDSIPSKGAAWQAEVMATENEITLKYMPNEACVRSRTLHLNKGRWNIIGLSEACD